MHYDNGDVIRQEKCPVYEHDSASTLAQRIHALEHQHYPVVIENVLLKIRIFNSMMMIFLKLSSFSYRIQKNLQWIFKASFRNQIFWGYIVGYYKIILI